jgi:hypothetical protein
MKTITVPIAAEESSDVYMLYFKFKITFIISFPITPLTVPIHITPLGALTG